MTDDSKPSTPTRKPHQTSSERQPTVPGAHDELLSLLRTPGLEHRERRRPDPVRPSDKKKP